MITWKCGVVAVENRVDNLLLDTIDSLDYAGFKTLTVFVDGLTPEINLVAEKPNVTDVTVRAPRCGHLLNWCCSLVHLYFSDPKADRYALFEDDLEACPSLFEYLDTCYLPGQTYWNLLTHNENLCQTGNVPGWHTSNQKGRGAVGLVFSSSAVRDIIASKEFTQRPLRKRQAADGMVMDILKPLGYSELVHYPSLVQHVGEESVMGHDYGRMLGYKSGFDPMSLI